jgi:hypothetical protein
MIKNLGLSVVLMLALPIGVAGAQQLQQLQIQQLQQQQQFQQQQLSQQLQQQQLQQQPQLQQLQPVFSNSTWR